MSRSTRALLCCSLLAACDTETKETVASLEERVAAVDRALEEQAAECKAQGEGSAARVATLEAQVADLEADKVALEQRAASLEERVAALQAEAESLKSEQVAAGDEAVDEGKGITGVPECDEYLAYFKRCIEETMPPAAQEASRKALATSEEAWAKAASTEAGREALAEACKTALDAAKPMCG